MTLENKMDKKRDSQSLAEALKTLLQEREASTQESICAALEKNGYEINQSKVSRLLRKIGAVKIVNIHGQTVYSLPREPAPPTMHTPLKDLIVDVVANETLVVIFTSPGSASMVARILDYKQISTEVLGTVAGDDTIFVAPKSIKQIQKLHKEIKNLLIS
jgi:transcriptional regulator of arginine metabolism